jgi:hypothetical protein
MRATRKFLPSPAMIVACAALVIALGGVSYAAAVLPKNSVGTTQLQKKAVSGAKIKNDAVTGAKVRSGSLLAADFKTGQLPVGAHGPKGDPGPQGPKGDTGAAGAPGVSGVEYIQAASPSIAPGSFDSAMAICPAGKKAIGGGGITEDDTPIVESFPNNGNAWVVRVRNDAATPVILVTYAVCANAS